MAASTITRTRKRTTTAAKAEAPAAAEKPSVDGAALEKAFVAELREKVGKLETVKKQSYFRLMKDGRAVAYVRRTGKGLYITIPAYVESAEGVSVAVEAAATALRSR